LRTANSASISDAGWAVWFAWLDAQRDACLVRARGWLLRALPTGEILLLALSYSIYRIGFFSVNWRANDDSSHGFNSSITTLAAQAGG